VTQKSTSNAASEAAITEFPLNASSVAQAPSTPSEPSITPATKLPTADDCKGKICPTEITSAPSAAPAPYAGALFFTEQRSDAIGYLPAGATPQHPGAVTIDDGKANDGIASGAHPTGIVTSLDGSVWFTENANASGLNGIGELDLGSPRLTLDPVGSSDGRPSTQASPAIMGQLGTALGDTPTVHVKITPLGSGCTPDVDLDAPGEPASRPTSWAILSGSYGPLANCKYRVLATQTDQAGNSTTATDTVVIQAPPSRTTINGSGGAPQTPPVGVGPVPEPPARVDRSGAGVIVTSGRIRLGKHYTVPVRLLCAAGQACRGTVLLKTSVSGRLASIALGRPAGSSSSLSHRTIRLGLARFRIAAHHRATVNVRLSAAGRRLVKTVSSLRIRAVVTARGSDGRSHVSIGSLRLVVARRSADKRK
jgi:hypothetical protein